jgi:hypothetical protein
MMDKRLYHKPSAKWQETFGLGWISDYWQSPGREKSRPYITRRRRGGILAVRQNVEMHPLGYQGNCFKTEDAILPPGGRGAITPPL